MDIPALSVTVVGVDGSLLSVEHIQGVESVREMNSLLIRCSC